MNVSVCVCSQSPEEVVGSPGAGIIVSYLLWVLGRELVLWKSGQCS